MSRSNRRVFLGAAAAAGTLAFVRPVHSQPPANDKPLKMGIIGVGWYGMVDAKAALKVGGVEVTAVCDVDSEHLDQSVAELDKLQGKKPQTFKLYTEMLEKADLDVVVIATPPHWHALQLIACLERGLDVYAEKPLAYDVREGRALVDTTTRYGTVHQTGHQRRSVGSYAFQVEMARNGKIGQVHTVICQVWEGPTVGLDKPRPVPAGFDYDMWLGPTAWHPYTDAYVNGWNYFWDTGAGPVIGMGCHYTDIAQWGLLRDDTGPVSYEGRATWKADAYSDTPVTADCTCTYADGVKIVLRSSGAFQDRYIRFVGSEGWVQVDDETNAVTAEPKGVQRLTVLRRPATSRRPRIRGSVR